MITTSTELNGKGLYYSFLAGAQRIFDNQHLLNKINVFPVADADTGTNIASTLRSIVDTFIPTDNLKTTAVALADAALIGARGNSGIIFAQFLYGFSNEIEAEETMSIQGFALAIKNGVKYAYDAISNPVEGTMITVIREWSESVYAMKDKIDDFNKMMENSVQVAMHSLEQTPHKLEVLAKANVVDAGGKAFVLFLEGIIDFFKAGELKSLLTARNIVKVKDITNISHEEITFRYCTEALLTGLNIDKSKIKRKLNHMGDSLVVAGSDQKVRVHIHTDHPSSVFATLNNYGLIGFQKVDDMVFQKEINTNRKASIALLSDSTADLPQEYIDRYQFHIVPLSVHFGEQFFLDGITLSGSDFSKMYFKSTAYPTTAQPAFKDFTNKYSFLTGHYDSVISFHITSGMSGTWSNSSKAAKSIGVQMKKRIDVIDSKRLSGGLGMIMIRAAQLIESGASHDEIVARSNEWSKKTHMFVTAKTMKYIVRSGRVSPIKGFIGNLLKIKPVIIVNDLGVTEAMGKPFTEKGAANMVMRKIRDLVSQGKIWNYVITHFQNEETAKWYIEQIKEITGREPLFVKEASPVLSVNVGPGVVAVSIMME